MKAVMVPGVLEVSTDELATLHREIDQLKKELHNQGVMLAAAVKASGGCVRVPDRDLVSESVELLSYYDPKYCGWVLRTGDQNFLKKPE